MIWETIPCLIKHLCPDYLPHYWSVLRCLVAFLTNGVCKLGVYGTSGFLTHLPLLLYSAQVQATHSVRSDVHICNKFMWTPVKVYLDFSAMLRLSKLLPPATKLGQGYVFTGVCDSVHRGGGVPDQVHPPTGYTPRTRYTPPAQSMLGDTVNARTVRILLECNLVTKIFSFSVSYLFDSEWGTTLSGCSNTGGPVCKYAGSGWSLKCNEARTHYQIDYDYSPWVDTDVRVV